MSTSVLVVGHVCWDMREGRKIIGGAPMYMYPVLRNLYDELHLLTSCTHAYPLPNFDRVYNIPTEEDTIYEYQEGVTDDRELVLASKASDLSCDRIDKRYDSIIVSAIAGEINLSSLQTLIGGEKFLDMQSLVRDARKGEKVRVIPNRHLNYALTNFDFVKASSIEVTNHEVNTGNLLLTDASGVTLLTPNKREKFESKKVQVVDTTGSGDVFLATFAGVYLQTKNIETAIDLGQRAAAVNVMHEGVPPEKKFHFIHDILEECQ